MRLFLCEGIYYEAVKGGGASEGAMFRYLYWLVLAYLGIRVNVVQNNVMLRISSAFIADFAHLPFGYCCVIKT